MSSRPILKLPEIEHVILFEELIEFHNSRDISD